MTDLVATCPKHFWAEWIAEGDPAGAPESGEEWGWFTRHHLIGQIKPGDRLYIVAHGRLRGYAPVTRVSGGAICRRGGGVAVTIDESIPGFQGLRERWWTYADERPFPDWKIAGVVAIDVPALTAAFDARKGQGEGKFTRRKIVDIADQLGVEPMAVILGCDLADLVPGASIWFRENGGITRAQIKQIRRERGMTR